MRTSTLRLASWSDVLSLAFYPFVNCCHRAGAPFSNPPTPAALHFRLVHIHSDKGEVQLAAAGFLITGVDSLKPRHTPHWITLQLYRPLQTVSLIVWAIAFIYIVLLVFLAV